MSIWMRKAIVLEPITNHPYICLSFYNIRIFIKIYKPIIYK